MFSATKNPYTEPIATATDEKQTVEDWGSLLTIWEKVNAEGETGARNCVTAIVQRLQHRNANVQLFSLTLANALVQNCGKPLHREIAGKTFTDTLKRLILDRNTHEKVKQKIAGLIKEWSKQFERDTSLGIMGETYDLLQSKGVRFEEPRDDGPPPISDTILKREEEDLQRAIAESEREAQRRTFGSSGYQPAVGTAASSSQKPLPAVETATSNGSYPSLQPPQQQQQQTPAAVNQRSVPEVAAASAPTRVRALYDFDPDPDQPGELPLKRGDVVRIIDAAYQEWWRGELRGRVGIFPVTYVEVIQEPSADALLAEAQFEANVFSQAGEVDRLLHMLQTINPDTENVGDNDELSDLYQKCLMLRPKVLKLVEKYTTKKNELLDINNRFMSAKVDYEAMLDDSWRQHNAVQGQHNGYATQQAIPPQVHHAYEPSHAGALPHRQGSMQTIPPHLEPPYQHPSQGSQPLPAVSSAQPPLQNEQPQPFYDHATNQWWYPPGQSLDERQSQGTLQSQQNQGYAGNEQPPYQSGYAPLQAPPNAQFASMHLQDQPRPSQGL